MVRRLAAIVLVALIAASPATASASLESRIEASTIARQVDTSLQARAAVRVIEVQAKDATGHPGLSDGEGEVIAWNNGYADPLGRMVIDWLASPEHAAVVLNADYTRIGCAVAYLAAAIEDVTGSAGWYGVCILSALPATVPDTAMRR